MLSRKMILIALAGGPLAGAMLGLAIDPAMKPSPEPTWRKIAPDPIYTQPQRMVHSRPQDLSPTWYMDRMPTWKRRAAMREAAMYEAAMRDAVAYDPYGGDYADYAEPVRQPEPASDKAVITVVRGTAVARVAAKRDTTPLDEAAAAAQAVISVPAAQSAIIEDNHALSAPRIDLPAPAAAGA